MFAGGKRTINSALSVAANKKLKVANSAIVPPTVTSSLEDYIKHTNVIKTYSSYNGVAHWGGSTTDFLHNYAYMPNIFRSCIRGLLKFVFKLHAKGLSMQALSLDQLYLQKSRLKVHDIQTHPATDARKGCDLMLVHTIVDKMLGSSTRTPDIVDFLDKLSKLSTSLNWSYDDIMHLQNHLGIMSSKNRLLFFEWAHEKKDCMSYSKVPYDAAIQNMTSSTGNWQRKFYCALTNFGAVLATYWYPYTPTRKTSYSNCPKDFVRCCRHSTTHLAENTCILGSMDLEDWERDAMISSVFIEGMLEAQENFKNEGILSLFAMKKSY